VLRHSRSRYYKPSVKSYQDIVELPSSIASLPRGPFTSEAILAAYLCLLTILFLREKNMQIAVAYEAKRFREKPYTHCFECIQGSKLKCKKCMSALIRIALEKQSSMRASGALHNIAGGRRHKIVGKTGCQTPQITRVKSPEEASEVNTIY
jgi:hypothetical protein